MLLYSYKEQGSVLTKGFNIQKLSLSHSFYSYFNIPDERIDKNSWRNKSFSFYSKYVQNNYAFNVGIVNSMIALWLDDWCRFMLTRLMFGLILLIK